MVGYELCQNAPVGCQVPRIDDDAGLNSRWRVALSQAAIGRAAWSGFCWVLMVLFCGMPIPFGDAYVHVKMGERIVETGQFPREDVFSYGETKPIESAEWLSQLIIYYADALGGEAGLHLLKWLLGMIAMLLVFLYARMRGAGWLEAHLAVVVSAALCAYFLNMRPRQFSLVALVLVLIVLEKGHRRPWLLLAYLPMRAVWMHLHGEVRVGDLLFAVYVAAGLLQRLLPSLPWKLSSDPPQWRAMALASGVFLAGLLLTLLLSPFPSGELREETPRGFTRATLSEWGPLDPDYVQNYHVIFFLILSFLFFLRQLPRLTLFEATVFFLFWAAPFWAQRMVANMAVVTVPLAAGWCSGAVAEAGKKRTQRQVAAVLLTLFLPAYMLAVPLRDVLRHGFNLPRIWRSQNPDTAVAFIRANRLPGRMYNDFDWGDYLIYALYPNYQVAQDARFLGVYKPDYLQQAMGVQEGARWWKRFLDAYHVSWVLIRRFRPLYALLDEDPDWQWLYEDHQAAIFVRLSEAAIPYLERAVAGQLRYPEEPLFFKHYGKALVRRGFADLGIRFLTRAQLYLPDDPVVLDTLAIAYRQRGEMERAFEALQQALAMDPDYAYAHARLSLWYWEQGDMEKAKRHHQRALELDPENPIALRLSPMLHR